MVGLGVVVVVVVSVKKKNGPRIALRMSRVASPTKMGNKMVVMQESLLLLSHTCTTYRDLIHSLFLNCA